MPEPAIQAEDPMLNRVAFAADDPARLPQSQTASQMVAPEIAAVPAGSHRRWLVPVVALAAALIVGLVTVYLRDSQPVSVAQKQGVNPPAPDVSGRPNNPARPAPLPMPAKTDTALPPTASETKPAIATDGLDNTPAQSNADAAPTQRPTSVAKPDVNIRQAPSILKECSQAVATLGLCSPDTKAEKK